MPGEGQVPIHPLMWLRQLLGSPVATGLRDRTRKGRLLASYSPTGQFWSLSKTHFLEDKFTPVPSRSSHLHPGLAGRNTGLELGGLLTLNAPDGGLPQASNCTSVQ